MAGHRTDNANSRNAAYETVISPASAPDLTEIWRYNDVDGVTSTAMVAEDIDAIVGYDANGHYCQPDHIKVHQTAHAEDVHADWVIDVTYNR